MPIPYPTNPPRLLGALLPALALAACVGSGSDDPPPAAAAGVGATAVERINSGTRAILPDDPGKNWVFDAYISADSPDVAWSRFWTKAVDLTGVAWDRRQTLTLISPRHALMAKHYKRKPGSIVIFHDRKGREVPRGMSAIADIANIDLSVVLLHDDVPPSVKYYKVLPPSDTYAATLSGALALISDAEHKVHVHQIHRFGGRRVAFAKAEDLPDGFYEDLITGDSGNPAFLFLHGEPVLIETHTTGGPGSGPFLGHPDTQAEINAAMRALSETNGAPVYQLTTSAAP